jgi:hypothetical protein
MGSPTGNPQEPGLRPSCAWTGYLPLREDEQDRVVAALRAFFGADVAGVV